MRRVFSRSVPLDASRYFVKAVLKQFEIASKLQGENHDGSQWRN
jgi:hypothetical protein